MRHSDDKGIWVPAPMAHPVMANETRWWMVGSVDGVCDELGKLESHLATGDERLRRAYERISRRFQVARQVGLPFVIGDD